MCFLRGTNWGFISKKKVYHRENLKSSGIPLIVKFTEVIAYNGLSLLGNRLMHKAIKYRVYEVNKSHI
jgi:hypothetical protein